MVHLINPRANHQAHSTHSFKGLAEDTALWFTWEDSQHMCLQEQAVGTWSRAAAEMGLLGAAQLCQPHPKHHTRCPTHSEWKCAFSLATVCFVLRKSTMETYQISMRDHVQVRQDPGSSCSGAGEGTAPFYSDGPLRAVVQLLFGLWWAGSSHQSILTSHQCGKFGQVCPYSTPGHGMSRMPEVPWVQQGAWAKQALESTAPATRA